jgi:DNA polymerase III sliding clamp (beta) subunit (PCNA family)
MKKEFKFLLPAIGDNMARRNLTFLQIVVKDNKMTLTAANGYLIKRVVLDNPDLNDGEYYVSRENVKMIIKASNKNNPIIFKQDGVHVGAFTWFFEKNIDYPNLDFIINRSFGKNIDYIALSNSVLQAAIKNAPSEVMKFQFNGLEEPVKIIFEDLQQYMIIILPVKIQW